MIDMSFGKDTQQFADLGRFLETHEPTGMPRGRGLMHGQKQLG